VDSVLSDRKMVLKLALLSLTESMRKDPDKYRSLIYNKTSSSSTAPTTNYSNQYYDTISYGQQQQYPSQDYTTMLLEESEKLYNKLSKELVDEIISDYASNISTPLALLPRSNEEEQRPALPNMNNSI
jgi:hypothetical protein